MSKPEQPERTPAEEWAYFRDWFRGLLGRSVANAKKLYPPQLSGEKLVEERRAEDALEAEGDKLFAQMREFTLRLIANGKAAQPHNTPPKEAKK